jgi:ankyrin repeat protein
MRKILNLKIFILLILLFQFTNNINAQNNNDAKYYDNSPAFKKLLEEQNNDKLYQAIKASDINLVKKIIKNKDTLLRKYINSETPLHIAVRTGNKEIVTLLINAGANINIYAGCDKPINIAVENNNYELVSLLVDRGTNINYDNCFQNIPIIQASSKGNFEMVKLFYNKGNTVNQKGGFGETPLLCATLNCSIDVVDFLIKHGANVNAIAGDYEDNTALHACIIAIDDENYKPDGKYTSLLKILLENHANPKLKDRKGLTPQALAENFLKNKKDKYSKKQIEDLNQCISILKAQK